MDLKTYLEELLRSGSFVVGAVMALGSQMGKIGISGKAQLAACFGVGFIAGSVYFLAVMGIPTNVQGWMFGLITAFIMGSMPSGLYEVLKASSKKGSDESLTEARDQ